MKPLHRSWCKAARKAAVVCILIAPFIGKVHGEEPVLPLDAAIAADQNGKATQASAETNTAADIPIWRRITLGTYKGPNAVRNAFDALGLRIGNSADEILGRPAFPFSRAKTTVDLVKVTMRDLGFAEKRTTVTEIYKRAAQLGLELCPAEVGPLLRLEYRDQPVGEFLQIAMQPVATYGGDLVSLTVANGGAGLLLLGGDGRGDIEFNSGTKFIFVRPARIANIP